MLKDTGTLGLVFLCAAAGCMDTANERERSDRSALAQASGPASAQASIDAVLGFEDASLWNGPGAIRADDAHSQGQFSLAVEPAGYSLYRSEVFAFGGRPRQVAVDLQLPTTQPDPYWLGAVQLYLESRSAGIYNAYIGQVELTGKPLGVFTTLSLDVPSWIADELAPGVEDLEVRLALNVPGSPGVYLLDDMRIRTELQIHYRFDDTPAPGVVLDSSGYGRDGTLQGAAALTASGRTGSALDLDGASAYVELPSGITEGLHEVTVAAWVNLDNLGAWSRIFDLGGAAGFVYLTPSTHDGLLRYSDFAGFGVEGTVTAPALPTGVWKHVAVTARGRDYRVFIDGIEAASALTVAVTPADIGPNDGGNWIGRSRFPDPLLDGRVDDFRVYDRVLEQPEIAALAAPGSDHASWRFDELGGQAVHDSSDIGLDGILSGAAAFEPGLVGGALRLIGSGGHVELPAGIVESCDDLTATAWVKLRSNPPWNRVFDFGKPDFSSFMYLSPAGFGPAGQELRFGLITPLGVHDVGFPYVMSLDEWTHLAVVLRDETATLFLNGRAVTRRFDVTSSPSDMGRTIGNFFGRSTFAADPTLDGALDDLRLACRAFDDREIAHLAHLPAPAVLPDQVPVRGDIAQVHDPAIIRSGGAYRIFSTGPGLLTRTSSDLTDWTFTGSVFAQNPSWVTERFGPLDALWAPDVSSFGGTHHLYYAASTFGSNRSCIGHATKDDLASAAPWLDHGPVICSNDGSVDDYNAIDPNVIVDVSGTPWLSFGSFWGGLKMVRLNANGERADDSLVDLARRPVETSIEAPTIIYRAPYYYLFASFDFCCRGSDSSYRVVVGRSTSATGPYLDRSGLPMMDGGGTPVVSGNSRWRGPGHNAILERDGEYLHVYHSYDALAGGIPTLRISELVWQEGWPISAEP